VGEIGSQGEQHTYGVAFVDDSTDFWQMEFPPPPSLAERPLELVLECTACGASVTLLNSDYEFDVCAIHGGLVRYCTECGFATVWKRPEAGALPAAARAKPERKQVLTERFTTSSEYAAEVLHAREDWELQPLADAFAGREERTARMETRSETNAWSATERDAKNVWSASERRTATALEDRRGRVRAKVNYFACVKSAAFGQDVVMCIDMSRGGLGFRTKNAYLVSTEVTVAVPFSPESPNAPAIFVPARVVNIRETPESGMYRCGVMFLPAPGAQAHP